MVNARMNINKKPNKRRVGGRPDAISKTQTESEVVIACTGSSFYCVQS